MLRFHPTDGRGPCGPRRPRPPCRLAPVVLLALLVSACATAPPVGRPAGATAPASPPFEVGRDTFAFVNLVRAESPDRRVPFANYCILMARGVNQFFRFARFAPEAPAVSDAEYTHLAREVMGVPAWEDPWPPERRIVIPGYPNLHALSAARERAVKAAFGSALLSLFHWRNWRVALPLAPGHQPRLAGELVAEVTAGRPAPLMITSFPTPDYVNHAVLVYDYRRETEGLEFLAYDPNDPANPLELHFDPASSGFWVEPLPYGPPGRVRAFRLFASPLL